MQLPASYVREHLSLGYAVTRDSAQGGTVDTPVFPWEWGSSDN